MVQEEDSAWPARRPSPSWFSCDACCTQPSGRQTLRVWTAPGSIHSQADQEAGTLLNPKATPAGLNLDCCFLFQNVLFHREAEAGCNLSTSLLGAIWLLDSSRGPHKGSWKARLSCGVGPGPSCLSSSQRKSLVPIQGKISEKAELA